MRKSAAIVVLAVVIVGCMDSPAAPVGARRLIAPLYSLSVLGMTDIGALGGLRTDAEDINELGQLAISTSFDSPNSAFFWQNGSIVELQPSNVETEARALNDHGVVAGTVQMNEEVAALWEGSTATSLVALPASLVSHALGINNNKVVVGNIQPVGGSEAFVWTPAAGMKKLFGPGGPLYSIALDVNDHGAVVGGAGTIATDQQAFINQNGITTQILGPGWTTSLATAVNEVGQVAGQFSRVAGESRGFVWTPTVPNGMTGTIVELGTLGGPRSGAEDINDLGQVVGIASISASESHAFLWDGGPLADPNRLEDLGALSLGESFAHGINNSGRIAGSSDASDGQVHAVIWTVPILARIDIEPGDATNSIRLGGSGPVNVAILTNPFFNASAIDPASLTIGDEAGNDTPIMLRRNLAVAASLRDVDRDGDLDLQAQFDRKQLTQNGDLPTVATSGLKLTLLGAFRDGKRIRGRDLVNVVP